LSGTVDTAEQRQAVEQIAVREGAESVANEIALRPPGETEDPGAQLARKVEFELYSTDAFDLRHIEITAGGGEVRLGGSVRSLAERLLAERIARDVAGVDTVVDDLEVASTDG
jgi:osmotically-inducible protein OsmY